MKYCSKCGKQLDDSAAFCDQCGAPTGAQAQSAETPATETARKAMPPIITNLTGTLKTFFTTGNQTGALVKSAKDTSWSGAIVLIIAILVRALAEFVNVNQALEDLGKHLKLGSVFGMSLLTSAVMAVAGVALFFVVAAFLCKAKITIQGSLNVIAYASLPLIVSDILGMIIGFIWNGLPIILNVIVIVAVAVLVMDVIKTLAGTEKSIFLPALVFVAGMVIVLVVFTLISYKATDARSAFSVMDMIGDLC